MSEQSTELAEIDPRNVLALVSPVVRETVLKTLADHPDWFTMHELELEKVCEPSINCTLIRVAFWDEYQRAQDHGKNMMMSKIYDGVMTKDSFYKFLDNPKQVAWMMCPPASEFLQMKADTYRARQEYSKILRAPLFYESGDLKGQVNIKQAKLSLDIYKMYSDRIHGSIVQRVEKKIQNIPANDISGNAEDLIKELEDLRSKQADVVSVIDVGSKDDASE